MMCAVDLSVIVATRNRVDSIAGCLESIASALSNASPIAAEIVVVDNGSEDNTSAVVKRWAETCAFPVRLLIEPRKGYSVALNCALRAAQGRLLAFTDDDCRMSKNYVNELLRHYTHDTGLVVRGGRIELGDSADLPLTIKTDPVPMRWYRQMNSARHLSLCGQIQGCNMAMPRRVVELLGSFDERFGPGSIIGSGGDSDYLFRAYLADIIIEYVPDMIVFHYHGRKQSSEGNALMRRYSVANGALFGKYFLKDPNLCRLFAWDVKSAIKEIVSGNNTFLPIIGFSHKDKVVCGVVGAMRYLTKARSKPMQVEVAE
jgi:glycosyltransferase involved in cell wall biosynthesis